MNEKNKRYSSYLITFTLLVFFINYFINEPDFTNILKTTKTSSLVFIIFLCLLRIFVISYLNIYLYRLIEIKIKFKESFKIVFMNRAGNQLMPFKLGSGYKLHYFVNKLKTPLSTYMSINTGQSLINLFLNSIILLSVVNIFSSFYTNNTLTLINLFLLTFIIAFLLLIYISFYLHKNNKIKEGGILFRINYGIKSLFTINKNQISFLGLTFLLTLLNIYIAFYIANMYVENNSLSEAIKLYSVGQFTGVISITPGNIGITELILISLQKLYVYKTSEILAISLVGRVADYIVLVLLNFFVKKTD